MNPSVGPSQKRKSSKIARTGLSIWYLTLYSFLTMVFLDAMEGKVPGEFLLAFFLLMVMALPIMGILTIYSKVKYSSLIIYMKIMAVLLIGSILCDIL